MGADWPLWMVMELMGAQYLADLELEMAVSEYLIGESEKIAKGMKDWEDRLRNITENLAEREADCDGRLSQVLG